MSNPTVIPVLRYRDPEAAIDFLEAAFGFTATAIHETDNVIEHAELSWAGGMVMLGPAAATSTTPASGSTYVVVEDPDAHFDRSSAAGAEIVSPLQDLDYGSRDYAARDPEGNIWHFGTYQPQAD